jgi:DNA polymerase-3 subunit delta
MGRAIFLKYLKEDIKNKRFKKIYLLHGDERFLVDYYANALCEALIPHENDRLMNETIINGKEVSPVQLADAADTLPFFSPVRLVVAKNTRLFAAGRKADSETMAAYIPRVPESTVILFIETEVDKRGRMYKRVVELGRAVSCDKPTDEELIKWIANVLAKKNKKISKDGAALLLRMTLGDMTGLYGELHKLIHYTGDAAMITHADVEAIASPQVESRIFELVAALVGGDGKKALNLYRDMLQLKESPLGILVMIARQYRLIIKSKCLYEQKKSAAAIAAELNLRSFMVEEALRQAKRYPIERWADALTECAETDIRIKSGRIKAEPGLEILMVRLAR